MKVEPFMKKLPNGMYVRPSTYDESVIKEMPRAYGWLNLKGKRVLDIGANIGAFSRYSLDEGAERVWAFEPAEDNFALAQKNAPDAFLHRAALVSGDMDEIRFYKTTSGKNPGNYSTVPFRGREEVVVPAINFQKILEKTQPQIIKFDCEGSEYDLLKCKLPDTVEEIAMELHLNKKEFRARAEQVIALFDTWEFVKYPKYNDKSWHCILGVRKKPDSVTKVLEDYEWFY